ncbi:predicted protein [Uncinocarpus reesii 1704]|uniref:Uncharacterized protein n=1 Tax=Uncinocarpus reesii (strain UAMH 1704) TaxID=336963 RepID=C4JKR1_UNCRE|nr:uncharacterized protein UREG_00659 [Uncinocarpus reesii 1704]EEP75812.1 predicted protein [Uncinocarpus reesii 1704]
MAFNFGKSNNWTIAERSRRDHGPFVIPFPKSSTREQKPFGIKLSGAYRIDYERVQIRIAAAQHGLKVLVENGGQVVLRPGSDARAQSIKALSDDLDSIYNRFYSKRFPTPKRRPVGYIPVLWNHPQKIQQRIPRHRKIVMRAFADLAKVLSFKQRRKLGHLQHSRPATLMTERDRLVGYMEELGNLRDQPASSLDVSIPGLAQDGAGAYPLVADLRPHDQKVLCAMFSRLRQIAETSDEVIARQIMDYGKKTAVKEVIKQVLQKSRNKERFDRDNIKALYSKLRASSQPKLNSQHTLDLPPIFERGNSPLPSPRRCTPGSMYDIVDQSILRAKLRRNIREMTKEPDRWYYRTMRRYMKSSRKNPLAFGKNDADFTAAELKVELTDAEAFALIDDM